MIRQKLVIRFECIKKNWLKRKRINKLIYKNIYISLIKI